MKAAAENAFLKKINAISLMSLTFKWGNHGEGPGPPGQIRLMINGYVD